MNKDNDSWPDATCPVRSRIAAPLPTLNGTGVPLAVGRPSGRWQHPPEGSVAASHRRGAVWLVAHDIALPTVGRGYP